jgi:two-component system phosphate regulon sensor histidine kinase PhoR
MHVFRRILLIYAILIFVVVVLAEFFITTAVRSSHEQSLAVSLEKQINLVADSIPFDRGHLDPLVRSLKEKNGARITLISPDGLVLGDSDQDSSLMDNHLDRPEIQQAAVGAYGMTVRMSDTLKYDSVYVAKRIERNGEVVGFIRMALPLREADRAVQSLRFQLFTLIGMALLVTSLYSISQARRLKQLIGQLREYSAALAGGAFGRKLFLDAKTGIEFTELADNLNTMSEKLLQAIMQHEEEKERLRVILNSNPDPLLIIDVHGTICMASVSAQDFFGEPLVSRPYIEIVRNRELIDLIDRVRVSRVSEETEFRTSQPSDLFLKVRVTPLCYKKDELSGFVVVFHDMTKIRKLERMRTDFVANVSHELKTPLTAIRGFSETLLDGAIDEPEHARKFLLTIKNHAERLDSIVSDLMTISRIELGDIKVEKTPVSAAEVIDAAIMVLRDKAQRKGLLLISDVAEADTIVMADKNRLIQILLNLIDNAVKFTDAGSVTVSFHIENETAVFSVKDTGIGIPKEHLDRIGERFYRVDAARSRELGGTGLGLAIVKHLVRAHGWHLSIQSEPQRGTTISVLIEQWMKKMELKDEKK